MNYENSNPNAPIYLLRLNILQEQSYALSAGTTTDVLEGVLAGKYTLRRACELLQSIIDDYKGLC